MSEAVDFLLFAPLAEEREAVLRLLPNHRALPPDPAGVLLYHRAELPVSLSDGVRGAYSLVLTSPIGMGRVKAAAAVGEALHRFTPRYVLVVGIAGGVAGRAALGDVLVSEQIVDYELQKQRPEGPEVRYEVYRADAALLAAALGRVSPNWSAGLPIARPQPGAPELRIGPVASGDKVVAARDILLRYQSAWPKLLGVEMEAGGVAHTVLLRSRPPGLLMIRGVSDHADEAKDHADTESWRGYACAVAAHYTLALLQSGPVPFAAAPPAEGPAPAEPRVLPPDLDRAQVRTLLSQVLRDIAEFDAFCLDYFDKVHARFAGSMDRTARTNLLLEQIDLIEIVARLRQRHPERLPSLQPALPEPARHTGAEARARLIFGDGETVHFVDRDEQTEKIKKLVEARRHTVVLLPGAQGEAHELFLARLEKILPPSPPLPPRRTIWVHWPRRQSPSLAQFPTTESEMLSALSQILGGRNAEDLPARLAFYLREHDLLILHPLVERCFDEPALALYYTVWLPRVIEKLHASHSCLLVQPVSWSPPPPSGVRSRLAALLHPGDAPARHALEPDARRFLTTVEGAAHKALPVVKTLDLQPIQRSHVLNFLDKCNYAAARPPAERDRLRAELVDRVLAGKATSEMILNAISAELPELF